MITSCIAAICITGAVAIDGDTLRLNSPGKSFRLRLWGIDAPELKAPLGIDAREALARLVDNKTVSCDLMDVDRYGRPVVRCGTARLLCQLCSSTKIASQFARQPSREIHRNLHKLQYTAKLGRQNGNWDASVPVRMLKLGRSTFAPAPTYMVARAITPPVTSL